MSAMSTSKALQKKKKYRAEDWQLYVMAAPTIVFLLIFCYAPMLGLVMAFQDYNVSLCMFGSKFVGMAHV